MLKTKTFVLACLLLIVSGHGFAAHVIPGSLNEYTTYDSFGHPLSITLGGVARNFRYNGAGCKIFESYPGSGSGTSYTCDALNRVKSATNGDGSSRSYLYGPGSMSVTDERSRTTTYTYRSYGNPDQQILMGITAPDSSLNPSRSPGRDSRKQPTPPRTP